MDIETLFRKTDPVQWESIPPADSPEGRLMYQEATSRGRTRHRPHGPSVRLACVSGHRVPRPQKRGLLLVSLLLLVVVGAGAALSISGSTRGVVRPYAGHSLSGHRPGSRPRLATQGGQPMQELVLVQAAATRQSVT